MKWAIMFIILNACVDPINFKIPLAQSLIVVEGMISDGPGPYTVKVSSSLSLTADSSFRDPIQGAKIKLFDDEGSTEDFVEASRGVYLTGGVIQGKIGHAYYIVLEMPDGNIFKSEPDMINPVGEVQEIRFEFEARTVHKNFGDVDANVFNIYMDANAGVGNDNYVRWRYTGFYQVNTHPELHQTFSAEFWYKTPPACSGYIVNPALGGGELIQTAPCTCCTCWVTQFESEPNLSDNQFVVNNQFKNIKLAEVPINSNTFSDKYMVEVEQMSLTLNSFEFFKLIRVQKEGASSLFQPPSGQIVGNIIPVNSTKQVVGLFWGTSIKSKYIFIQRSDVPYLIPPPDFVRDACTIFPNAFTTKPDFWQ